MRFAPLAVCLLLVACVPTPTFPLDDASADTPTKDTANADALDVLSPADARTTVCTPGAQVACACVGGGAGAQVCAQDGSQLGPCLCPDAGDAGETPDVLADVFDATAMDAVQDGSVPDVFDATSPDVIVPPDATPSPDVRPDVPTDVCGPDSYTLNDPLNCGMCGNVCPARANATLRCHLARCEFTCAMGFGDCDGNAANGCEATFRTDNNNCGGCGEACTYVNGRGVCDEGTCALFECLPGYGDCDGFASDGCEVNLNLNRLNCGACGVRCSSACSGGHCV